MVIIDNLKLTSIVFQLCPLYLFQEPLSNDIHSRMEAIEEIMDNLHIDSPGCQVTYYVLTADFKMVKEFTSWF